MHVGWAILISYVIGAWLALFVCAWALSDQAFDDAEFIPLAIFWPLIIAVMPFVGALWLGRKLKGKECRCANGRDPHDRRL